MARLTWSNPILASKVAMGYKYEKNKLGVAGLTGVDSELGTPQRPS